MIAVVPVRGAEAGPCALALVAEAGGSVLLAGDGAGLAAQALLAEGGTTVRSIQALELGTFGPAGYAAALASFLENEPVVILPATPDGRDLAPRLAALLGRPLLAGALSVSNGGADLVRWQGSQVEHCEVEGPFVATLLPGPPGALAPRPSLERSAEPPAVEILLGRERAEGTEDPGVPGGTGADADPELLEVIEADPAVVELGEADRIIAGGGGLGAEREFRLLEKVAKVLCASVGGTRVVTDAGYLHHDRQIGTTGVAVSPRCYVAIGISGAAQHLGGLRPSGHVLAVNLDASCPMMSMADVAFVTDAKGFVESLAGLLGVGTDA